MTLLDALRDPALFGSFFANRATWRAWQVFLAALFGQPLTDEDAALFRSHTGRQSGPKDPAKEAWVIVGRRGGKSRIAALIAVFLACFRDYKKILAPGEVGTLPIVAADRRQARTVMGYVKGLLHGIPMLEQLVVNETAESIELSTGCRIEIHTASWRSIRGYTVVGAVLDEVAFWRSEDSANPDVEIVNALRPAMATVPDALLVAISSPYARRGILWEQYRKHHGQDGDPVLFWQATTRAMNPTVPEGLIAEAYADDEAAAAAEYGAEFRRDLEAFIACEVVDACTMPGRFELAPVAGTRYVAFADPSGGSADAFTLAVAHAEERAEELVAVLDCVREVRPPFSPDAVVQEFAGVLKGYGVTAVRGDRYGGDWPAERFRAHGIAYDAAEQAKSDLYRELLPMLNAGRVELLDVPRLRAQLLGLERRTGRSGKDSIDHAPGAHDDVVNAVAGALVAAVAEPVRPFIGSPDVIAALIDPDRRHPFASFETNLRDRLPFFPSRFDRNVAAARAAHVALAAGKAGVAIGYAMVPNGPAQEPSAPVAGARNADGRPPREQLPIIVVEALLSVRPAAGGVVLLEDVVRALAVVHDSGVPLRLVTASPCPLEVPFRLLRERSITSGELLAADARAAYPALLAAIQRRRLQVPACAPLLEQLAALELNDRTGGVCAFGSSGGAAPWTGLELADAVAGLTGLLLQRPGLWVGANGEPVSHEQPWTPGEGWVRYGDQGDFVLY